MTFSQENKNNLLHCSVYKCETSKISAYIIKHHLSNQVKISYWQNQTKHQNALYFNQLNWMSFAQLEFSMHVIAEFQIENLTSRTIFSIVDRNALQLVQIGVTAIVCLEFLSKFMLLLFAFNKNIMAKRAMHYALLCDLLTISIFLPNHAWNIYYL